MRGILAITLAILLIGCVRGHPDTGPAAASCVLDLGRPSEQLVRNSLASIVRLRSEREVYFVLRDERLLAAYTCASNRERDALDSLARELGTVAAPATQPADDLEAVLRYGTESLASNSNDRVGCVLVETASRTRPFELQRRFSILRVRTLPFLAGKVARAEGLDERVFLGLAGACSEYPDMTDLLTAALGENDVQWSECEEASMSLCGYPFRRVSAEDE